MKTKEEEIKKRETILMNLGFAGMAYSSYWNKIAKELNKLKEAKE